ncbi:EscD/YscD/HrpQ family type III secretion system inner membrane ring protein [Vibrio azureus]|uniref:Putative type III secretion system protein n=1 Tax=Vibrio azureus NBRC 104587 TaxID=1219077 RepID=U3C7B3_9VIBR|nr:type III secretion system inner membrane ring subunit SctD [Vibrio azureus]AUI86005.1 EscD/YscD/HrpQ family type III secretion system inner membrane ring protein [Vibrio azureus]GAD74313.1 putative type III secretion system protein [Vibrio azureus NBRC 104587]
MEQWKIRILSGVHSGVEVNLPSGSFVLGSDDFIADVVLTDSGIKASHLTIETNEEGPLLLNAEEVKVDGDSVTLSSEGLILARQSLVSIGSLRFSIGYVEDDLFIESDSREPQSGEIASTQKTTISWKKVISVGLLCSLLPSAILAGIWWEQTQTHDQEVIAEAEPIVLVRNTLKELQLNDIRVEWNATEQQAVLDGYIEDRTQQLNLLDKIDALGINYKSDLRTMEEIRRGVKFILRNLGYHQVKVENGEERGTVLLTGYIDDASRWSQVEQILERDVPGLIAWKVELKRAGAYMDTLKTLLTEANLLTQVQLVTNDDRIEIRGDLDDLETTRFYGVTRQFREQYGEKPYLVLKSIPKVSKGKNIDFPFKSVNFGEVPYVILTDNIRYVVGAKTPQGYRISSITADGIELVKAGQIISIDLGHEGNGRNDKS